MEIGFSNPTLKLCFKPCNSAEFGKNKVSYFTHISYQIHGTICCQGQNSILFLIIFIFCKTEILRQHGNAYLASSFSCGIQIILFYFIFIGIVSKITLRRIIKFVLKYNLKYNRINKEKLIA